MPAAGSKGTPKNPGELKDDTSSSREEKKVNFIALSPYVSYLSLLLGEFPVVNSHVQLGRLHYIILSTNHSVVLGITGFCKPLKQYRFSCSS
ncbi:unnamed protein product [Linum tenue]|uniref:Uncharacterized protein n=1 Tax=Linum tenue TaxID=586396 RepID=A0AAV0QVP9_9ROSI|nr:unnamed protein product [Linum tenue]